MKNKRFLACFAALVLLVVSLPLYSLATTYARVISKDVLYLRTNATTDSEAIGRYRTGTKVEVLYNGFRNWVRVRTPDGKTGYMYRKYLSNFTADESVKSGGTRYIKSANGGSVNFRQKASAQGKVIAQLRPGTKVTLLTAGKSWSQIWYNGKTGWIKTKYLSKTK
ncbi:MAG: SH3 domain-containing protein [Clostridiales bacterium]|nr:SH3 domain-containing protein [Clostridiales bacterium]